MEVIEYISLAVSGLLFIVGLIQLVREKHLSGFILLLFATAIFLTTTPAGKRVSGIELGSESLGNMKISLNELPPQKPESEIEFAQAIEQAAVDRGVDLKEGESVSLAEAISNKVINSGFSSVSAPSKEQYNVGSIYKKSNGKAIKYAAIELPRITKSSITVPPLIEKEHSTIFGRAGTWVTCENAVSESASNLDIKEALLQSDISIDQKGLFIVNEVIRCKPLKVHWDPGIGGGVGSKLSDVIIGYKAQSISAQ